MPEPTAPMDVSFAPGSPEADAELVFRYLAGRASLDDAVRAFARIDVGGAFHLGDEADAHTDESPESRHVRERIMSLVARLDATRSNGTRAD